MKHRVLAAMAGVLLLAGPGPALAQESPADRAFDFADVNGDGVLSFEEVARANPNVTREIFDRFDTNGDGVLSREEFAQLFVNGPRPPGL